MGRGHNAVGRFLAQVGNQAFLKHDPPRNFNRVKLSGLESEGVTHRLLPDCGDLFLKSGLERIHDLFLKLHRDFRTAFPFVSLPDLSPSLAVYHKQVCMFYLVPKE